MQHSRTLVFVVGLTLGVALVVGACTSAATPGPSSSPPPGASTSALSVVEQITATSARISATMTSYAAGQNDKALEAVTDAYLEHFEFVEGPLGAVDAELAETLEDKIRVDLREAITVGRPIEEVTALGTEIVGLLAQAAAKLE